MNDRRVAAFREALQSLLDSMEAVSRLNRWDASDPIPESLEHSAKQLEARLVKANALAASNYVGNVLVMSQLNGLSDAIRRLDLAYVTFRKRIADDPSQHAIALEAMNYEVDEVKDAASRWC